MKKLLPVLIALSMLCANTMNAQDVQGPKAEKKERKMEKKADKMVKKDLNGSDRKTIKKKGKAIKKADKQDLKQEKGK